MYTELKSYQIIISLLKKYDISHCVLSAGSRNVPFVHSVEEDPFFTCYSVVDERSAGYFALGLAQQLQKPVVISCTSSTATCNYWPPVAEAFYQGVPLVILTSDRNPALLGQWEDQMIDQVGMFDRHVKKSVNLPIVNDNSDVIYCRRLVNEALMELNHRSSGPVHINIPMKSYNVSFNCKELIQVQKFDLLQHDRDSDHWKEKADKLKNCKRILVLSGQNSYVTDDLKTQIRKFYQKYNCSLAFDLMTNMDMEESWNPCLPTETRFITNKKFSEICPDIVISFGYNIFAGIKDMLRKFSDKIEHWLIDPDGKAIDAFLCLTSIFESTPEDFFRTMNKFAEEKNYNDRIFDSQIKDYVNSIEIPELDYNNVFAIRKVVENIPSYSILHLSINGSIRITNMFKLNPHIRVYANIGTHGIDGCLSSFLGQSIATNNLAFLITGDLSFFYDMNAIRIKHIKKNVRILLINNHGGEEFYYNGIWRNESSDLHTSARHDTKAEGWVKETAFKYLSAHDKTSFMEALPLFMDEKSESPILLEVFTEMRTDAKALYDIYEEEKPHDIKSELIRHSKELIRATIGSEKIKVIADKLNIKY